MVFREPGWRPRAGSVAYGPFPVRKGRLLGSFAALLVAVIAATIALQEEQLTCTADARCVLGSTLVPSSPSLPSSPLRRVSVAIVSGSKGAKHGVVVLAFDDGREVRLLQVTPAEAEDAAREIRSGIEAKRPIDVTVHGPRIALVFTLGAAAMWLTMLYSALKGLGRMRLELVQDGAGLRVRRRVLGIPLGARELSLEGVTDVRVETGTLGEMWLTRGQAPSPAARLVAVDRSGESRPITDRVFPGQAVHLRAASDLRALLGFERQPGGVEDQLVSLPKIITPLSTRIAFAWIGVTVGSLLCVAAFGLLGLAFGLLRANDTMEGAVLGGGGIVGAASGIFLALYLTRARVPR